MAAFPLKLFLHKGAGDIPPGPDTYGVCDAHGYWATVGGARFELPADDPENAARVEAVVTMLNATYEQGRSDAQADIRQSLGIEDA